MNCDCIKRVEDKLKGNGYPEASLSGKAFMFPDMNETLNIKVTYRENKKDGTPKKSKSSINMAMTFCPFCGKRIKEEKEKK